MATLVIFVIGILVWIAWQFNKFVVPAWTKPDTPRRIYYSVPGDWLYSRRFSKLACSDCGTGLGHNVAFFKNSHEFFRSCQRYAAYLHASERRTYGLPATRVPRLRYKGVALLRS